MKKLMIFGGLVGFAIGTGFGMATRGATSPSTIVRAAIAAFVGGLLMRWWGSVWVNGLRQAALAAEVAAKSGPAPGSETPAPRKK